MKLSWKTCFKIGISIFILYLCIHFWPNVAGLLGTFLKAATPLFIGALMAYIINILMSFYERHYFPKSTSKFVIGSRRPVCLVVALITLIAIVSLVVYIILPELIECVKLIIDTAPEIIDTVLSKLDEFNLLPENISATLATIDWQSKIGQIVDLISDGVTNIFDIVLSTVMSVFSGIVTGFLAFVFAIYMLAGKEKLYAQSKRFLRHYLKEKWYNRVRYFFSIMSDSFHKYIVGQCTEALIIGVLCTIGMLVLRLPYATMIGALIAFTALIPVAGAYIGAIVGALLILTVSPVKALIFLVFLLILQQLEGNIIYPKVVGSSMGLPGIWVLAAVTIGGGVMGVLGMLLGVPLAATIYRLVKNDINKDTPQKCTGPVLETVTTSPEENSVQNDE